MTLQDKEVSVSEYGTSSGGERKERKEEIEKEVRKRGGEGRGGREE